MVEGTGEVVVWGKDGMGGVVEVEVEVREPRTDRVGVGRRERVRAGRRERVRVEKRERAREGRRDEVRGRSSSTQPLLF